MIKSIIKNGFTLVQSGEREFSIRDKSQSVIVEVQLDGKITYKKILKSLEKEVKYHVKKIRERDYCYFKDCTPEEKEHIKTTYFYILKGLLK